MKTQSQIPVPCDVCGQLVRLWSDGTIVDHRNKRTHHRCKGSGYLPPMKESTAQAEDRETVGH